MTAMMNVFKTFAELDPLLQAMAVIGLIAFALIVTVRVRRYLRKRRHRRRDKQIWVHY